MEQLLNLYGSYEMVEVNTGIVKCNTATIWRHAGDHKDGNQDSWFPEVQVRLTSCEGHAVDVTAHMYAHDDHGITRAKCLALIHNILAKGEINLKYWRVGR